jgi:hypothetical protein
VRLEGLGQLKNPMTSSKIEPATFRLVALCLNQLHYRVPRLSLSNNRFSSGIIELLGPWKSSGFLSGGGGGGAENLLQVLRLNYLRLFFLIAVEYLGESNTRLMVCVNILCIFCGFQF